MIEFYVSGQTLKFFTPVIAADSLNYLTAKVNFTDAEWDGYSKWLHFKQDEELGADTYDVQLNEDNEIVADDKLNLTVGQWEIYLTGTKEESRLTTVPVILTVQESGLIDAPLHELPMSVAERVDFNAKQALQMARYVKDTADAGGFDGKDGTSLAPLGHFSTAAELDALVSDPKPGDVYSVGSEPPYDLYVWDGIGLEWRNHGQLQGVAGEDGKPGATFFPSVDANGNISWTNNGGYDNPTTRNIRGPKGEDGSDGPAGPGAYEKAQEAGYTGTEATFYAALTYMPYHNARHLPDGGDPIVVQTGNLADGAVTEEKVADKARTQHHILTVTTEWDGTVAPYTQTLTANGMLSTDRPKAFFMAPSSFTDVEAQQEAFAMLYDVESANGSITLYAKDKPAVAFTVLVEVSRI
jgi:hypothetical protein